MEYSLFALLAILLLFPVAFLVLYLRRRQLRDARLRSRRRFHDLVAFDRARREEEWAAQRADGVAGIVLVNTVDGHSDPLRQAPPSAFAEVAPGIWRSVQGSSRSRRAVSTATGQGGEGGAADLPAPSQEEEHSPYGSRQGEVRTGTSNNVGFGNDEDEEAGEAFEGVTGKPVAMEEAASTLTAVKVYYGEAQYIPRSVVLVECSSGEEEKMEGEISAVGGKKNECAVEPTPESHLPHAL